MKVNIKTILRNKSQRVIWAGSFHQGNAQTWWNEQLDVSNLDLFIGQQIERLQYEPELEQVITYIKSAHPTGVRRRNDLTGLTFEDWLIVEQGLRQEWMKYPSKDLEVMVDVISYL